MIYYPIVFAVGCLLGFEVGVSNAAITLPLRGVQRKKIKSASSSTTDYSVKTDIRNADLASIYSGSSTTWIPVQGCGRRCGNPPHTYAQEKSSTAQQTNLKFAIQYGKGFADGYYVKDTYKIGNTSVPSTFVAVSNFNDGELSNDGADGIMGAGPDELSYSDNDNHEVIPTVLTAMKDAGLIEERSFSVYFDLIKNQGDSRINGEITFGGVDTERIDSKINYARVTDKSPFKDYWAINIDGVSIDNQIHPESRSIVALVDTGTTMLLAPEAITRELFRRIPTAFRDYTGLFSVPCDSGNRIPDFAVIVNGEKYVLNGSKYIIPQFQLRNSKPGYCYTYIQAGSANLPMILGYGFLQSVGTIYNADTKQIGFGRHINKK
ncbi:hypothetical protein NQZ79_g1018 [Umbelopsis isabellina]|nr:hypothetical protein NQZ79_g1018 [Umbelopsis isabellina]